MGDLKKNENNTSLGEERREVLAHVIWYSVLYKVLWPMVPPLGGCSAGSMHKHVEGD